MIILLRRFFVLFFSSILFLQAKRELAEQAANVMELRKRAEESDRKTIAFIEAEGALKVTEGNRPNETRAPGKGVS